MQMAILCVTLVIKAGCHVVPSNYECNRMIYGRADKIGPFKLVHLKSFQSGPAAGLKRINKIQHCIAWIL